eukprot:10915273-Alexandrium_andersonii.AAC.1
MNDAGQDVAMGVEGDAQRSALPPGRPQLPAQRQLPARAQPRAGPPAQQAHPPAQPAAQRPSAA